MTATLRKMLAIILLAATFPIAVDAAPRVREYSLNVGQFDRIKVDDNVNVIYRCLPDSTGIAVYRGEEDFCDSFILTNNKGELRVQVTTEDVNKPGMPVLYLYSDFLVQVENSSDFTLTVDSPAPAPQFKAVQMGNGAIQVQNVRSTKVIAVLNTGNGNISVSGKCEEAQLKMIGTGMISADHLMAQNVKCMILGSGSIGCWPVQSLESRGLGSTKIYYRGDPAITKKGGGKLFQLPQEVEAYEEAEEEAEENQEEAEENVEPLKEPVINNE